MHSARALPIALVALAGPRLTRLRLVTALAGAVVVSLLLRLPFLSVPLITDEAGYAYVAHWLDRGLTLYRDLWFDRPQGIFVVYGALMRLVGESTESIRAGAALYNAVTVLALYLFGRRLFGRGAAIVAAGLFAIASASPVVEGFTANGELFMNLPVVACLLLAERRLPFHAGLLLALATAVKPTALPTAGLALLVLLAPGQAAWPATGDARPRMARLLRSLARAARAMVNPLLNLGGGFFVAALPFAVHGILADPETYWYSVVGFRVQAHSAFSVGGALAQQFADTAPSVLLALLPLWLLVAASLLRGGWRHWPSVVCVSYLAGATLGAAAGGYWYWHYYVGLLPAAALLAGNGAVRLWRSRHRSGAGVVLAAASLVALFFNLRLVGATPEQTSWNIYRRPAYLASRQAAAYLRKHTGERDTIYAAFAEADLYQLSGRRSAGRHLYWTEINRVPGAYEAVLATLDDPRRRPKYVVRVDDELETPGRAAAFWSRVASHYREETRIGPFRLYHLIEGAPEDGGA